MPLIALMFSLLLVGPVDQHDTVKTEAHTSAPEQSGNDEALARYTLALAVFTGVLAVSTSLLSLFTYRLWSATRDIVSEGRDTARRQLRAYVSIDRIDWNDTDFPLPNIAIYQLNIKNSGQTPAYHFSIKGVITWQQIKSTEIAKPAPVEISRGTLAPGEQNEFFVGGEMLTPQELALLAAGVHKPFLTIVIEYTDAFKDRHYTNFRAYRSDDNVKWIATEIGNDAD